MPKVEVGKQYQRKGDVILFLMGNGEDVVAGPTGGLPATIPSIVTIVLSG
jgi:hypothetical protein